MKNGKRKKSMEKEGGVEERHAKEKKKRVPSAKIEEKEEDGAKFTAKEKTQDVKKKRHKKVDEIR